MNFTELGLSPKVLEAITAAGYITPTAIQAQAIPHALQRKDVLGLAQTGSGKTACATITPSWEGGWRRACRTLFWNRRVNWLVMKLRPWASSMLTGASLVARLRAVPQRSTVADDCHARSASDHMERGGLLLTGTKCW
jgi:hypothetical protein